AWMARVADREPVPGSQVSGDHGRGKALELGYFAELAAETSHHARLTLAAYIAAHQVAERACQGGNGGPVARHIGQDEAGDDAAATQGDVMHVPAVVGLRMGTAIDPEVQARRGDTGVGGVIAPPDFHALERMARAPFLR